MTDNKIPRIGSRTMVFHGTAHHTVSGLTRKDLMKTKRGRIVSKKKHAQGLKAIKHLKNLGYIAKRGTFKLFHKSDVDGRKKKGKRSTRRRRGGAAAGSVSPGTMASAGYAGKPVTH
jgi:hypothetical protein